MNSKLLTYFISLYIILFPFYIFPSGLPQPSDIVLALGLLLNIRKAWNSGVFQITVVKRFSVFLLLVLIINTFYTFYLYHDEKLTKTPFFAAIYFLFCYLVFVNTVMIGYSASKTFLNNIVLACAISLTIQIICIPVANITSDRSIMFFNNPNQLAYYALLMMTIFIVVDSKYRKNKFFLILFSVACFYFTLISASRIALPCIALLIIYAAIISGLRLNAKNILLLIFILVAGYYISQKYKVALVEKVDYVFHRIETNSGLSISPIQERGYDRMYLYPAYNFFGAGENANYRWTRAAQQLELHSFFGTLLFCYGILGFILFMRFSYAIIKRHFWKNLMILLPIILFNFVDNGERVGILWILLALIFINDLNNWKFRVNQRIECAALTA